MPLDKIVVRGAREHNLKNVDVSIPRDKFVVITGVSGSGKSSLAFDTIYAEGQRRFVESLSAYARQFLGRMDKPDVDDIEGLSPAISIDQKGTTHNPWSTVGTVTEIYDYLRLLYARVGRAHCYQCGRRVERQTVQQMVDAIRLLPRSSRIQLLAPVVRRRKGEHREVIENARKSGFVRARVDGEVVRLSDEISLDKQHWHDIDIIVDRLVVSRDLDHERLTESVETALLMTDGLVEVEIPEIEKRLLFSEDLACLHCGISLGELEPRTFSYNNPHGACSACAGLGYHLEVDPDLLLPDRGEGVAGNMGVLWNWYGHLMEVVCRDRGFRSETPVEQVPKQALKVFLEGGEVGELAARAWKYVGRRRPKSRKYRFEGVVSLLTQRYHSSGSEDTQQRLERVMSPRTCALCGGHKLRPESLAVTIGGANISHVTDLSVGDAAKWVRAISGHSPEPPIDANEVLTQRDHAIAEHILKEIEGRLKFLVDVGLDYLTLSRRASTLSGGESQRIRLATQIGSGLMGVLYVCDEPSIGLHPADDDRLIRTLQGLRDLGNSILVVEHDEAIMRSADHIVDLGPGAGEHGGHLVAQGTVEEIIEVPESLTGQYLGGVRSIPIPEFRRRGNDKSLHIRDACENNLQDLDVTIPLGRLVCITGVSGSGKSTLISEILHKSLVQTLHRARVRPGRHRSVEGVEHIDKVVNIDQSPIGRTPRSNPATYTDTFTPIRQLFAQVPEARTRGYKQGRFSFNVKGGRCEACTGDGYTTIAMQFLPDVTVPCESCEGARYNREALEIRWRDANIADVLNMTVAEALEHFENIPPVRRRLQTMHDVGLGYIKLGQPSPFLSGGEAQRVKLATELAKKSTGRTLYILDEPTTGLSFEDCSHLMKVLHRLVDGGNSVVLIEHHLDLIKSADWLIDLGPGPGDQGGQLVAVGTPEELATMDHSITGRYLRNVLNGTDRSVKGLAAD